MEYWSDGFFPNPIFQYSLTPLLQCAPGASFPPPRLICLKDLPLAKERPCARTPRRLFCRRRKKDSILDKLDGAAWRTLGHFGAQRFRQNDPAKTCLRLSLAKRRR